MEIHIFIQLPKVDVEDTLKIRERFQNYSCVKDELDSKGARIREKTGNSFKERSHKGLNYQ